MSTKTVTGIWIYPVKSLGGIRLPSCKVFPKGFEYDRRWMLVDGNNKFMTQREHPRMALFKLSFNEGSIIIRYNDQVMGLPFHYEPESFTADIWNDRVAVHEVSRHHSEWFSEILGMHCRLVSFPETNLRPVDNRYASNNEQVSLADGYPLLIIGQSSLNDLNARLKIPVPMNRFRPNIVFEGGMPYEEDKWKYFQVGNTRFAGVKPCSRCVMTTVDQDTGIKGTEPLTTLATYRRVENKVYFGQNLLPLSAGDVAEGDEIIVE